MAWNDTKTSNSTVPHTEWNDMVAVITAATNSPFVGCLTQQTAVTALTTSWVACAFHTDIFDTNTMHDNVTNNTRITIPTTGYYNIGGSVGVAANTICGARIRIDGTTVVDSQMQGNSGAGERASVSSLLYLTTSQYVELQGYASTQNSTGDSATRFWAYKVG